MRHRIERQLNLRASCEIAVASPNRFSASRTLVGHEKPPLFIALPKSNQDAASLSAGAWRKV